MAEQHPFEVRDTGFKGLGCFATRDIKAGEQVLLELCPLWCWDYKKSVDRLDELIQNFELQLSEQEKEQCLQLYGGGTSERVACIEDDLQNAEQGPYTEQQRATYTHLALVYDSNCFELVAKKRRLDGSRAPSMSGLFIHASRFNHSCDPNLYYTLSGLELHYIGVANRDIKVGDELTVTYIPNWYTTESRQAHLRPWGFRCTCNKCQGEDSEFDSQLEEAARIQGVVTSRVEGGRIVINEEDRDATTRLARRIQLLEALRSLPELYFAYQDGAVYYQAIQDEFVRTDLDQHIYYIERALELMDLQIATGEEIWPHDHPLLIDARKHQTGFRNQLQTARNRQAQS